MIMMIIVIIYVCVCWCMWCVCECVYVYVHVYVFVCMCVCVRVYSDCECVREGHLCVCGRVFACVGVSVRVGACVCTRKLMCICARVRVLVFVCTRICKSCWDGTGRGIQTHFAKVSLSYAGLCVQPNSRWCVYDIGLCTHLFMQSGPDCGLLATVSFEMMSSSPVHSSVCSDAGTHYLL